MKKGRLIAGIAMIVLSLCLIGSGTFLMINQNKIKFVTAVRKATANIAEDVHTFVSLFVPDEFALSQTDKKITTNTKLVAPMLNMDMALEGDMYTKYSTNELYTQLALGLGGNMPLNIDMLVKDTKLYVKLADLIDNYYFVDLGMNVSASADGFTDEELVQLKDYLVDSTFDALAKNKITKTEENLTLNTVSYKLEKLVVDVTERNLGDAVVIFLKKIDKDKTNLGKRIKDLATANDTTLQEMIKEAEADLKDFSTEKLLTYAIYTDKSNVIMRHEIIVPMEDDSYQGDLKVSVDSYKDKENRNQFMITVTVAGMPLGIFEIKGIDATQSTISLVVAGMPLLSGTYTRTAEKIELGLMLNLDEQTAFDISYVFETVAKGKEYSMALGFTMPGLSVTSNNQISLGAAFPPADVAGARAFDAMTEEEQMGLLMYLTNVLPAEFLGGLGITPDMLAMLEMVPDEV